MVLVYVDPELAKAVGTKVLLIATWPTAYGEVMQLLTALRVAGPTLFDALAVSLVTLITPPRGKPAAEVSLGNGDVVLRGVACRESGGKVTDPHTRPQDVRRLEVIDLAVAGRSWLGLTG